MRVVLVFIFSLWIEHPEKGDKDGETSRCHSIRAIYSREKARRDMVAFLKWLKGCPAANGEVWFCVP